jgi:hypothetical protein
MNNLQKYEKDLDTLITNGNNLNIAMSYACHPELVEQQIKEQLGDKVDDYIKDLPSFEVAYQSWYSESLAMIRQLLPDRFDDFSRLFAKPKSRKEISFENYVVEDYLQGLQVTRGNDWDKVVIVNKSAAITKFQQQLNILKAVKQRFKSSLFDIKQLVQADLLDSELDAAHELNKKGFARGGGAIAGVVLESHLLQVCHNHKLTIAKKNPAIGDLNDLLKDNNVIEISLWRQIQHLADLRNKCDHKKPTEPTKEDIDDLIEGVKKVSKTVF